VVAASGRPARRGGDLTPAAVLFDLDGVLVDSRVAITRSYNFALEAVGVPQQDPADLERWIGPPALEAFTALVGAHRAEAAVEAYRFRYRAASLTETLVAPGMDAALPRIAALAPTAVATSKPRPFAVPILETLGLARYLRVIEGPSLDSLAEPKSQTVARALGGLGLGPGADAVMVGDRRHDVVGAHANGIRCIGVLWGIGSREELEAAGADAIVEAPDALLSVLSASV
jgi:phosphoglycolate phosphatase